MKSNFYLLLIHDLTYVMKHIYYISYTSWCFFNLRGKTDTSHGCCFHGMSYKGLWIVKALKQNLPCCHSHLELRQKNTKIIESNAKEPTWLCTKYQSIPDIPNITFLILFVKYFYKMSFYFTAWCRKTRAIHVHLKKKSIL